MRAPPRRARARLRPLPPARPAVDVARSIRTSALLHRAQLLYPSPLGDTLQACRLIVDDTFMTADVSGINFIGAITSERRFCVLVRSKMPVSLLNVLRELYYFFGECGGFR